MDQYVPVVKIRGVQVWRNPQRNQLYVYSGPGRSEWTLIPLRLGLDGSFALEDLLKTLEGMGLRVNKLE